MCNYRMYSLANITWRNFHNNFENLLKIALFLSNNALPTFNLFLCNKSMKLRNNEQENCYTVIFLLGHLYKAMRFHFVFLEMHCCWVYTGITCAILKSQVHANNRKKQHNLSILLILVWIVFYVLHISLIHLNYLKVLL